MNDILSTFMKGPSLSLSKGHELRGALTRRVPRGLKNPLWTGLSARLTQQRERQELSGIELARRAAVGHTVTHVVEAGASSRIDTVEKLASVLGIPPGWLAFGDEGYEPFQNRRPRAALPPDPPEPRERFRINRERHKGCAERIQCARRRSALSMRQVAAAAGVSVQTWSQTESGATVPRVDSIERMAVALDVAPSWLAYGDDEAPSC